ncbi:hypothetical protein ACTNE0_08495 [Bacillota bacterium HCP3S3_E9]
MAADASLFAGTSSPRMLFEMRMHLISQKLLAWDAFVLENSSLQNKNANSG